MRRLQKIDLLLLDSDEESNCFKLTPSIKAVIKCTFKVEVNLTPNEMTKCKKEGN